ncbi:MAG: M16 family metallopeptidase [Bacteroidales bacterium]
MVKFEKHTLPNGLRVLAHRDETTPLAAFNLLYDVGARDETPGKTGFAHLFEHLMFEGSVNIHDYDRQLQYAGGENNAFTTNDITNYYVTLPAQNLEVAFWLESDRMLGLDFSEKKLETQKSVVAEEYRQSYLNQPYGDAMLLLRPLAYETHPYRWATIGQDIEQIKNAGMDDVKDFFSRFYNPSNAILCVSGFVDPQKVFRFAEKWFGDIPAGPVNEHHLPAEPFQKKEKRKEVKGDVPQHQIFMAYHMCRRSHPDYHATDLVSDLLANGESARLTREFVHDRKLFSEANAYVTGSIDPGMLMITARLHEQVSPLEAEKLLQNELEQLMSVSPDARELQKVKNRVEATHTYFESSVLAKAMNLCWYELLGNADLLNRQTDAYARVEPEDIRRVAEEVFRPDNLSILHYGRHNE